eukprot:scpid61201/ scgid21518/ 
MCEYGCLHMCVRSWTAEDKPPLSDFCCFGILSCPYTLYFGPGVNSTQQVEQIMPIGTRLAVGMKFWLLSNHYLSMVLPVFIPCVCMCVSVHARARARVCVCMC